MGEKAVKNHYVMPLLAIQKAIENIDINFVEEDEDQELSSFDFEIVKLS